VAVRAPRGALLNCYRGEAAGVFSCTKGYAMRDTCSSHALRALTRSFPSFLALMIASVLGVASVGYAAIITITFEQLPGPDEAYGTPDDEPAPSCGPGPLSFCSFPISHYSSQEATFSSGTPFQGAFFPNSDPTNHYISSSPLIVAFSEPVHGISVTSYSFWTAVLWAFDASNNVIASDVLTNPTPGGEALLGTLRVFSRRPIASFKVLADTCDPSAHTCDQILNVDDLKLLVISR
jgi:hypothetical protein